MPDLSIVIPAYNEEANVARTLAAVSEVASQLGLEHEIIVVNDGSTDGTGDVLRQVAALIPNLRVVEHYPNRGYGGALKTGFAAASSGLIAFVPADGQFLFDEIYSFLKAIATADIVCGYRANRQDNAIRRLNGWGWNLLVRLLFGNMCRDVDCGFKLMRRQVLEQVRILSDGAMIDTELLAGARAHGLRIVEVPVTHLPRAAGKATGANLRVIARALHDLLSLRHRMSQELPVAKQQV